VKLALPGVADIYQGAELWDLSFVDPDNRRPVDYEHRRRVLDGLDEQADRIDNMCAALRLGWRSGAVKLYVTARGLRARRDHAALFVDGEFLPVSVAGEHASNVVAFARRLNDEWALAVVPRLTTQVTRPPIFPVGTDIWRDTAVVLPEGAPTEWRDVLCGTTLTAPRGNLPVGDVLANLPVALLVAP
jgi:(1->4)-alpha-D-glucan 1-alpha-D-glucosylmutase